MACGSRVYHTVPRTVEMIGTKKKGEFVDNIGMRQNLSGNFVSETSKFFSGVSKPDFSLRQGSCEANILNCFVTNT